MKINRSLLAWTAACVFTTGTVCSAPAPKAGKQRSRPDIPAVARQDAICFAYYTVSRGVLKMTAQLYPLEERESRAAVLEIADGSGWKPLARTRVTEDDYRNYNYGRRAVAYLPTLRIAGLADPVVQVIDEAANAVVYTLRINGTTFRPKVFRPGTYTLKVGEPGTPRLKVLSGLPALPPERSEILPVRL